MHRKSEMIIGLDGFMSHTHSLCQIKLLTEVLVLLNCDENMQCACWPPVSYDNGSQ